MKLQVNPLIKESTKESTWAEREVRLIQENNSLRERVAYLEALVDELTATIESQSSLPTYIFKIRKTNN